MVVASNVLFRHAHANGRTRSQEPAQTRPGAPDLAVGVLFDRILDAVVIADLATGRIVQWNAAAEKLFGFSAREVIGQPIEILMPEPVAPIHRAGLDRYLRTGHGLLIDAGEPVEMPARTKSGEEIRIELALSELQDSTGERFAVAIIRDAKHRKQIELTNLELAQARVAQSEAEAALSARDELLDAVAATLQAAPEPDELHRLATALGDFKRLHSGQLTLCLEDADLVDLVHATVDGVRRRVAGRRLLFHAPPSVPARCDVGRTRQILEQILDEAMHRTSEGSHIEIELELPSARAAQLTVRAPGTGVPRELGVGLQLARALLQRQGGRLTTTLTDSGGLTVVMTLPGCLAPFRRGMPRRVHRRAPRSTGA